MQGCVVQEQAIPPEIVGELSDSSSCLDDPAELGQRLRNEGYLLLRQALDYEQVMAARQEILEALVEVGEIHPPAIEGIFTGTSRRLERPEGLGAFWKSVSEGPAIRQLTHGGQLRRTMDRVLGAPSRPQDYIFLRVAVPGRSTGLHYDHPFFARGSQRVHTVWLALGEVTVEEGPLVVVEGSNRFSDLIERACAIDYNSTASPKVMVDPHPVELARQRQVKLLTADFRPGDLVVFGMHTLHGSLDNQSKTGRVRLSCDIRFQPAADPLDDRYFGPDPKGTTGIGYAELNGAKPLTLPWHMR